MDGLTEDKPSEERHERGKRGAMQITRKNTFWVEKQNPKQLLIRYRDVLPEQEGETP